MRRAFMTGITSQDGSYLAELLLEKGYEVHGLIRRPTSLEVSPFKPSDRLVLQLGDLTDGNALTQLLRTIRPDEVYNLAAQSVVSLSFEQPEYTVNVTAVGAVRMFRWTPEVGFEDLVKVMLDADMQALGLDVIGDSLAAVQRAGLGWSVADLPEPSTLPAGDQGTPS